MTVDGTDFAIQEPHPYRTNYNRKFYSHKFKRAGLRYEVAVCIATGDIVWFHGPFPASFPDLTIFQLRLQTKLPLFEKVVADKGYRGSTSVITPDDSHDNRHREMMAQARGRHETVNRRFKQWQCLKQLWRHDRHKHHLVFKAVLCVVQLEFDYGHGPFQVQNFVDSTFS